LLVPQGIECSCRAAEVGASGGENALAEIWNAEDKSHARDAVKDFESTYGAKFPKAVAKITDDVEELLAFYHSPSTGSS
jgi:transposase-like protein